MDEIEAEYREAVRVRSDINQHLPILRAFAEKCEHVTEFGVRTGVSTRAFLAARPLMLVSYDLTQNEIVSGLFGIARRNGLEHRYVIADVLTVNIEPTDLLFIDTWHAYEQLSAELRLHAGKVRRWIIMHDTEMYGGDGEVAYGKRPSGGLHRAIGEFLINARGQWRVAEHHPNNNGLTVLARA